MDKSGTSRCCPRLTLECLCDPVLPAHWLRSLMIIPHPGINSQEFTSIYPCSQCFHSTVFCWKTICIIHKHLTITSKTSFAWMTALKRLKTYQSAALHLENGLCTVDTGLVLIVSFQKISELFILTTSSVDFLWDTIQSLLPHDSTSHQSMELVGALWCLDPNGVLTMRSCFLCALLVHLRILSIFQ